MKKSQRQIRIKKTIIGPIRTHDEKKKKKKKSAGKCVWPCSDCHEVSIWLRESEMIAWVFCTNHTATWNKTNLTSIVVDIQVKIALPKAIFSLYFLKHSENIVRLDVIYYHLLKVITMRDAASSSFNVCPCADVLILFWLSLHFKMSVVSSLVEKNEVV